ncbi:MAG: hypothetical protein AAGG44_21405 [Planctomycetota bacterium]
MPKRSSNRKVKQDRHAKLKMAAIPVLLAILGLVLWSNMGDTDTVVPVAANSASPSPAVRSTTPVVATSAVPKKQLRFDQIEWPEPALTFLEDESPFKDLDYAPEPVKLVTTPSPSNSAAQRQQSRLEEVAERIKNESVPFSFRSSRRNVVMLGGKLVQVGDEIDENVRVSGISDGSLELAVVAARREPELSTEAKPEPSSPIN